MKNKRIVPLVLVVLLLSLSIYIHNLLSQNISTKAVNNFFENTNYQTEIILSKNFLNTMDKKSLEQIGLSKKDIKNIENDKSKKVQIVYKEDDKDIIILYTMVNENRYITSFTKNNFSYKQLGTPIHLDTVLDIFSIKETLSNKYILFVRHMDTSLKNPYDNTINLTAYVYNDKIGDFVKSTNIIEDSENYILPSSENDNRYKKLKTKSDILLSNYEKLTLEVLTSSYEAVSVDDYTSNENVLPYNLNYDVIKTNINYNKYFYDDSFNYFLQGYLILNEKNEKVGILNYQSIINNNEFLDIYTVVRKNGEIIEVMNDYKIESFN